MKVREASVYIGFRLPKSMKDRLVEIAKMEHRSLSNLILHRLHAITQNLPVSEKEPIE